MKITKKGFYMHSNGSKYQVITIANQNSTRPEYPTMVVYQGEDGKVWSKSMDSFIESMSQSSSAIKEGDTYLCLLNGTYIVLSVAEESPTYEETFSPFLYWFEPHSDMVSVDWDEVTPVLKLHEPSITEEAGHA